MGLADVRGLLPLLHDNRLTTISVYLVYSSTDFALSWIQKIEIALRRD